MTQNDSEPAGLYSLYPRWLFADGLYAGVLTSSMKSVLPVLMRYMGRDGRCWPSVTTLCRLSGISKRTTVLEALQGFSRVGLIEIHSERMRAGGKRNVYTRTWTPPMAGEDSTGWFPFHHSIVDGGNWGRATPTARALYPVLRHAAKLHADDDHDGENGSGWIREEDLLEHVRTRQWDILRRSHYENIVRLTEMAGISRRSFWDAMQSLADCHLLEPFDGISGSYKVHLRPLRSFALDHSEEGDGGEQKQMVQKGNRNSAEREPSGVQKGNSDSAKRELEVSSLRITREVSCPTPEGDVTTSGKPWTPYRLTNHPKARASSNRNRMTPEEKERIIEGIVERVMRDGPQFNRSELWWDLGNAGLPVGQMSSFTGRFYTPNLRQIQAERRRRTAEAKVA